MEGPVPDICSLYCGQCAFSIDDVVISSNGRTGFLLDCVSNQSVLILRRILHKLFQSEYLFLKPKHKIKEYF